MSEEEILDYDENIYQKLARATARAVDINLGKTTLADLLDGYTKSVVLQQKIDKAIEYIDELREESAERQDFSFCYPDDLYIANIDDLLDILKGSEE